MRTRDLKVHLGKSVGVVRAGFVRAEIWRSREGAEAIPPGGRGALDGCRRGLRTVISGAPVLCWFMARGRSSGSSGGNRGSSGGGRSGRTASGGRSAGSTTRIVQPRKSGGWEVVAPHADRASAVESTQRKAEVRAKEIVKNAGGGEVVIKGTDGRIRDSDTVAPGNDPSPPKDTKH